MDETTEKELFKFKEWAWRIIRNMQKQAKELCWEDTAVRYRYIKNEIRKKPSEYFRDGRLRKKIRELLEIPRFDSDLFNLPPKKSTFDRIAEELEKILQYDELLEELMAKPLDPKGKNKGVKMAETTHQLLAETLEKIRKRIKQIRSKEESIGEENTKAVLINPLLSALGWNLEDWDEVCQEYKRKPRDNPVDYAFFILRSPQLLIEAKDFGRDLNDLKWISQTLGYATVVGVEWCVLTNGDEYRIYNSHAPVAVEEKLFRIVKISDPAQDEYTLDTLDLLSKNKLGENLIKVFWKAHFVDRHVGTALKELLRCEEKGLVNLIRRKIPELRPSEIRESLKRANIQIDFPVVQRPIPRKAKKIPKRLDVKVSDLIQAGLIDPPLELEREFKGVRNKATIQQDGSVIFNGERYTSLSTAGRKVRNLATNGWTFWQYYDPETGKLEEVDLLRRHYFKSIKK